MDAQNGLPLKLTEKYLETVGGVPDKNDLKSTFWAGIIALEHAMLGTMERKNKLYGSMSNPIRLF